MKLCFTLLTLGLFAASTSAQTFGGAITPLPIPDALGSCMPGGFVTSPVVIPSGIGAVTSMTVTIDINHTWYGDVEVNLTSPTGVVIPLLVPFCLGSIDDSSDLMGAYTLDVTAPMTLDAAALAAPAVIPPGTYGPDNGFDPAIVCGSVEGTWTFSFQDHFNGDTGTVNAVSITVVPGPYAPTAPTFAMCQNAPSGPISIIHVGGMAGGTYFNPAVVGAGFTPNGWFFGLDINFSSLLLEASLPPIFIGTLDGNGASTFVLPGGALPPNVTLGIVGVHFAPGSGFPYFASPAFDFVTQ